MTSNEARWKALRLPPTSHVTNRLENSEHEWELSKRRGGYGPDPYLADYLRTKGVEVSRRPNPHHRHMRSHRRSRRSRYAHRSNPGIVGLIAATIIGPLAGMGSAVVAGDLGLMGTQADMAGYAGSVVTGFLTGGVLGAILAPAALFGLDKWGLAWLRAHRLNATTVRAT